MMKMLAPGGCAATSPVGKGTRAALLHSRTLLRAPPLPIAARPAVIPRCPAGLVPETPLALVQSEMDEGSPQAEEQTQPWHSWFIHK